MGVPELDYLGDPFGVGAPSGGLGVGTFRLDDDTQLRIISANSLAGVVVGIQGLRVDATGTAQVISETHTPASNRTTTTQDYKLGKGTLLRLTLFVQQGTPLIGQTYVLAQLIRGVGGPRPVVGTLLGGLITATQAIAFPGSLILPSTSVEPYLRTVIGSSPAAGAEFSESVPSGARWELVKLFNVFQTSANPGTRTINLGFLSGGQFQGIYLQNAAPGPGGIWNCTWAPNLPNVVYVGLQFVMGPVADRALLLAGDVFRSFTLGLDVADQWGPPRYTVREWLEVQ